MDSVGISAGGRVARAHLRVERQRKLTSMMNGLEAKRYHAIRRQIEDDKVAEASVWNRRSKEILKYSDDMKAFQTALLRRISDVKEMHRNSTGIRPILNLGRYGGASINQIKANLAKFRPERDSTKIRLMKAKRLLDEGKRNGTIKTYEPGVLGDRTQNIMQLEKVEKSLPSDPIPEKVADLDDVKDMEENEEEETTRKIVVRRRRLQLPPLQVTRTMRPNQNILRRYTKDSSLPNDEAEVRRRRAVLPKIPEEINPLQDDDCDPMTSERNAMFPRNPKAFYQWNFVRPHHQPNATKNYLTNNQRFWKPDASITVKHAHIVLPKIR